MDREERRERKAHLVAAMLEGGDSHKPNGGVQAAPTCAL